MELCSFCEETLQGTAYWIRRGRLTGIYHYSCVEKAILAMEEPEEILTGALSPSALVAMERLLNRARELRIR